MTDGSIYALQILIDTSKLKLWSAYLNIPKCQEASLQIFTTKSDSNCMHVFSKIYKLSFAIPWNKKTYVCSRHVSIWFLLKVLYQCLLLTTCVWQRSVKLASPKLFRALDFTTLNLSSDAIWIVLTWQSLQYSIQIVESILWYGTEAISMSKQVK